MASSRKKSNQISQLKNDVGERCDWDSGPGDHMVSYFHSLFTSGGCEINEVLLDVKKCVSEEQNKDLLRPFTAKEIHEAVFSMHPDKSPGLDGMNPTFFQNFWPTIGTDVVNACLKCLNDCVLPVGLNDTAIVLIPKKKSRIYG